MLKGYRGSGTSEGSIPPCGGSSVEEDTECKILTTIIPLEEYKELLEIKGRYQELRRIEDKK